MLIIVISRTESYLNGAILIKETCLSLQLDCNICYIEDLIIDDKNFSKDTSYIVYFLTNVKDVSKYTDYFKRLSKSSVINNVFLISRMEKFSIQHSLYVAGVNVPKSIVVSNRNPEEVLQNLKLPLYMKSQKQADTVIQINTKDEFDKKISSKSIEDFYFEESVDMENFHLEKIYYINEYAEPRNPSFIITDNLMDGLKKISHVLKLDVYSVDIFFSSNTDDYKCIDVNPSSALFYSAKARIDFVQYVLYKLANS